MNVGNTINKNSALGYRELANRTLIITTRINAWIEEVGRLEALPALTAEQENRLGDISSALNSYDVMLSDAYQDPNEDWVERAVKGMGVN